MSYYQHVTDIVGYVYNVSTYCPDCILDALPTGEGEAFDGWAISAPMGVEAALAELAAAFGIDRMDESSYDSSEFPKVILAVEQTEWYCDSCGNILD